MELLVLLLLIAMTNGNRDFKHTLDDLVSFYRENRELISLLAGSVRQTAPPPPAERAPEAPAAADEKSRPRSEAGKDILENFLKNRVG